MSRNANLNPELAQHQHSEEALARSEKLAEMGRLAATVAHEINTPLTSLSNLIYLLSTHKSLDPPARQYVAMAEQELQRISRITRQVLGFSRESPKPVQCRISAIMDDILELYQPKLARNNIAVHKDYRTERAIDGYPSEMRQAFANLIGNAIDAIGNRGTIKVRISATRAWNRTGHRAVRISIADSGSGISEENRKFLFRPFFTTKGESGTGLGLWLSRGIIARHKGHIHLHSRAQKGRHGTVFSIVLPAAGEEGELPSRIQPSEPWKIAA